MRASIVAQATQQILENKGMGGSDGRGIATTYADLCTQANERLTQCASLARDGRLVESVHLADETPSLLDLCATLDFTKVDEWRALCKANNWPVAPTIDSKAIQVMNDAYGAGLPLEPLLGEYRAVIRNRDRQAAVAILRRLVQAEPNNQTWKEDLAAFETRRLEEIATETAQAENTRDIKKLTELAAEVTSASWSIAVGKELIATVEQTLRRAEIRQANADCQTLINRLIQMFTARDVDKTEEILDQLQTLILAHGIKLVDTAEKTVTGAKSWVTTTRAAEANETACQTAAERLAKAVEAGDGAAVVTALDGIARFNRTLPETLAKRANELADAHNREIQRVRRLKLGGCLAATITILVAGLLAYQHIELQKRVKTTDYELQKLFASEDLNGLTNRLTTIRMLDRALWKTQEMQSWGPKVAGLVKQWRDQRAETETRLQTAEKWIAQGFPDENSTVTQLLNKIQESLRHPSALSTDHARMANASQKWQEEMARRIMATAEKWNSTHDATTAALQACVSAIGNGNESTSVEELLKKTRETAKLAARFAITTETQQEMERITIATEQAAQTLIDRDSLITTLHAPTTLKAYMDAGTQLAANFPKHPLVQIVAGITRYKDIYEMLDEGPTTTNVNNLFWCDCIVAATTSATALNDKWQATKGALLQWGDEPMLVEVQQWAEWTGYGYRNLILRCKPQKEGDDYILTYFEVEKSNRTVVPEFKTERLHNVQGDKPQRLPYCAIIEDIIAQVRLTKPEDAFQLMAQTVKRIAGSNEIPPILKVRLLEVVLQHASNLFGSETPTIWMATLKRLQALDHEIHWLCTAHYAYARCSRAAAETVSILDQEPGIHNAAKLLRDYARFRGIQFVGVVPLNGTTNVLPETTGAHCELWTLRSTGNTPQRNCMAMAAEQDAAGRFHLLPQMTLFPGEPVFAPFDNRPTTDCVARIARVCNIKPVDVLRQMTASTMWPINAHE